MLVEWIILAITLISEATNLGLNAHQTAQADQEQKKSDEQYANELLQQQKQMELNSNLASWKDINDAKTTK